MKKRTVFLPLVFLLMVGCASFSAKKRAEQFGTISKAYENALRGSRFKTAYQCVDPATVQEIDFDKYKNIRVVEYAVTDIRLSGDSLEIGQTAEIAYYLLDRYVLRTIQDKQRWKYHEKDKVWLLQTGLPSFHP